MRASPAPRLFCGFPGTSLALGIGDASCCGSSRPCLRPCLPAHPQSPTGAGWGKGPRQLRPTPASAIRPQALATVLSRKGQGESPGCSEGIGPSRWASPASLSSWQSGPEARQRRPRHAAAGLPGVSTPQRGTCQASQERRGSRQAPRYGQRRGGTETCGGPGDPHGRERPNPWRGRPLSTARRRMSATSTGMG